MGIFTPETVSATVTRIERYTITAGEGPAGRIGFDTGAVDIGNPIGSIAPGTFYTPHPQTPPPQYLILGVVTQGGDLNFYMQPSGLPDTDATFSSIQLTGTFVEGAQTRLLTRASRDLYVPNEAGETRWAYTTISAMNFINGNDYELVMRWIP